VIIKAAKKMLPLRAMTAGKVKLAAEGGNASTTPTKPATKAPAASPLSSSFRNARRTFRGSCRLKLAARGVSLLNTERLAQHLRLVSPLWAWQVETIVIEFADIEDCAPVIWQLLHAERE
jgi:hypothetical protein